MLVRSAVTRTGVIGACLLVLGGLWSAIPRAVAQADAEVAGAKRITSIEGITEYRLENGLKVLLFPDASKPSFTVNMTVLVGSRHEGYGEAGMAHLLEHMLFKGTPNFSGPKEIPSALQKRGADYNASTWLDRTNYHETLPANDSNLEFAIKLEADRLINSYVHAVDLKSEMTVVRSEFEMGENNPERILEQRMIAAAFEWHNYGKNTIGNRADIERVPVGNLQEFYHRYYQPDNVVLVVAGKFQQKTALAAIVKYFGAIPRPERQLNSTYTEEPPQDGQHIVRLRRVGKVAVVGAAYHIPAGAQAEFPAVEVLDGVLSDDPAGRLYKSLVETKLASQVYGQTWGLHDPGMTIFLASVTDGRDPDEVLKAMETTIADVASKGVTQVEVDRIKQQILKQREMTAASSAKLALDLSEWAAQGDWRLYFLHRDRIEKVTAAEVSNVAAKYLRPDNSTLGVFVPTKSPERSTIPATGDLAKMIGDYKGRKGIARGEEFDVSPANLDARTKIETLPSGIKAAFLEKKTRGNEVHLRLELHYGDAQNLQDIYKAAGMLPDLMMRGTKHLTKQQIQDKLDGLKATLHLTGAAGSLNCTLQTRRESLPNVLRLLKEILREPSLPESELELIKQSDLSSLQNGLAEPTALAGNAIRRHLAPYPKSDPRHVSTLPGAISLLKSVTIADVKKLYANYLGGGHGELAVVGDFDKAEIEPLLHEMFADWKPEMSYAHISRDVTFDVQGGHEKIETPDKANAVYLAGLVFPMRDDDPQFPALALGDYILGESTLSSRLGDRVRQKEGLTYGVRSSLTASAEDRRTAFAMQAICNPININKVSTAISEELERLLSKGIPKDELATAKQGYLQDQQLARTSDRALVTIFCENLTVGRSMKYYADFEQKVAELTGDQIISAMRSHIDPKRLFIVTAGDFTKSEAASSGQ